jgi:DNA-binding response OmpR family regulator
VNRNAKILIVEDELPLALLMVHLLACAGCAVQITTTGKKGLELANACKFDLITLDIELPDINGFEICSELRRRHISRNTPVIFISGNPCKSDIQEDLKRGAVDYIEKPFNASGLVSRLLSHVGNADSSVDSPFEEEFP